MPTSWLQNVNPIFIIVLAPVFGYLWTWLARRNKNPSIPLKFALGLTGLSVGFFVLAWGAAGATKAGSVAITWLVVTYFLHTVGELCLSPVGLSSITKLAPRNRISQMMGLWFVAAALGNLFAGLTAGTLENKTPNQVFTFVGIYVGAAASRRSGRCTLREARHGQGRVEEHRCLTTRASANGWPGPVVGWHRRGSMRCWSPRVPTCAT